MLEHLVSERKEIDAWVECSMDFRVRIVGSLHKRRQFQDNIFIAPAVVVG